MEANMKLSEVQMAALSAGKGKIGFAYYMEMGMGKTLISLTEFLNTGFPVGVVICPNSFKGGWVDEIRKHGLAIDACIFESGSPYNNIWVNKKETKPRLLIINY